MSDTEAPSADRRLRDLVVRYRVPLGLLVLVVLIRPVLSHDMVLGYGEIANTILIWMLFAASFNLLLGYSGLLSFGHAMFFGIGVYAVAMGLEYLQLPVAAAALVGLVLAGIVAYLVGRLIADRGEIYFAMLTLAFAETVHYLVNKNYGGYTGGSAGLPFDSPGWFESVRGSKFVVVGGTELEWFVPLGAVFFLGCLAIWQLARSPFGRTLVVIRENEALARAVGVDTRRYKVWAFAFSGAFAALAGVLLALDNGTASLSSLTVQTSGDVIMMTVLGGANYFFGPLVGVFAWLTSETYLNGFEVLILPLAEVPMVRLEVAELLSYWRFFLGFLFVLVVLLAPREGLWGRIRDLGSWLFTQLNRLTTAVRTSRLDRGER